MRSWTRPVLVSALGLAMVGAPGCFKSSTTQASSESSSDTISSPFRSSSESSGSDEAADAAEEAFRRDVTDTTVHYAAAPDDVDAFQRDLSAIAESHGLTDWERHDGTYLAIGRGLALAGVGQDRFAPLAVPLVDEDPHRLELVRLGYSQQRVE